MMKMKKIAWVGFLTLTLLLSACSEGDSGVSGSNTNSNPSTQTETKDPQQEETQQDETQQVVIHNFNQELIFEEVPERVISLSYGPTEILVAMGLESHIIGIAEADNTIDIVYDEHKSAISQLNILAKAEDGGVPSLEVVIAEMPDFVYGSSYGFNANYGVGDPADFLANDINIYASASTYVEPANIEDTYQEILDMGKIFQVEDKATALVEDMTAHYTEISTAVADVEPVSVLLYYSGTDSPFVYFPHSFLSSMAEDAGAENVLEGEGSAGRISLEIIIETNPDFIVVMEDSWESVEEKIAFFKSSPELAEVTAVKEDNFVVISLEYSCFSSVHNVDAMEMMAKAFHPDCFS